MQIICRETIAYARELVFGDEWDGTPNADAEAVCFAQVIALDMTWPVNSVRATVLEKIPSDSANAVIEQAVDLLMIAHVGDLRTPGVWQRRPSSGRDRRSMNRTAGPYWRGIRPCAICSELHRLHAR